jgi:hypothetical protein
MFFYVALLIPMCVRSHKSKFLYWSVPKPKPHVLKGFCDIVTLFLIIFGTLFLSHFKSLKYVPLIPVMVILFYQIWFRWDGL